MTNCKLLIEFKLIFITASLTAVLSALSITALAEESYKAPRNEYGHPNLRGVWNFSSDIPLERPVNLTEKEFFSKEELDEKREKSRARAKQFDDYTGDAFGVGGYNSFWIEASAQNDDLRTSLLVDPPDGQLPERVKGAITQSGGLGPDIPGTRPVRYRVGGIAKDGPEDRGLSERCLMGFNSGPPFVPSLYNNNVQIFQTGEHIVLMTEMIHDARIIPLDNRPRLGKDMAPWSGESRAHWEGESLIVETENFTNKIDVFRNTGSADNMKLTERFTRVANDKVQYQFTINDPQSFVRPFTVLVNMPRVDGQIYEYACHEGNYAMVSILTGARLDEKSPAGKLTRKKD